MLGILLFIIIIIGVFFLFAFLIELVAVLFVGFLYIALWSSGIGGQTIVVIVGLIVLVATFPKQK